MKYDPIHQNIKKKKSHPCFSAKTPASCKLLTTAPLQSTGGLIPMDASLQYTLNKFVTLVHTSIYDFGCAATEAWAGMSCDEDLPVHKTLITWRGNQNQRKKENKNQNWNHWKITWTQIKLCLAIGKCLLIKRKKH